MKYYKLTIFSIASAICLLVIQGCNDSPSTISIEEKKAQSEETKMPWEDPEYKTDIRATKAESRPGPDESGWTAWMRHHEDRKKWCSEKDVDLLMVGDSIVFGWSRKGKEVWDAYYGDRNAVNIGSSGDRTYHMLWHFQNGGLDGMKDNNPELVVMMIGTNNRGEPELKGEDTAYGVLALLKEIHAKLPESKILLMPIFPRGDTPDDPGRVRNAQVNEILKTYVDNETVHWLDINDVFLDEEGNLNRDLMPDGLHPNLDGYWAWAEAMESSIAKFLDDEVKEIERPLPEPKPAIQPENLGRHDIPNPDFVKGDPLPEKAVNDWTLGATGAQGWMYCYKMHTQLARQIYITEVAEGSPSDGILEEGDVLLGVDWELFDEDPRQVLGSAITAAEAEGGDLTLIRWRDGKSERVTVKLPVLGSYSPTAPYDCPKSELILEKTAASLAERMKEEGYEKQNPIVRSLNALGLLATGNPEYHPLIKKEAEWAADYEVEGFATWYYGYVSVFLAEYIMATGDDSVLPGLRRIAMEAYKGQSVAGSWGHRYADENGRLPGYGMMNSPGAVLTIGLVLAREAGVDDPEVATAIKRSYNLLQFYIGKGSIPYGDHAPFMNGHEDNGKNGMVTVLFDQLGNEKGARFFSKMSTAAHGSERDTGHTGNYFNVTWAMPGVARGGPNATGAWMKEFGSWYFDLARTWDWRFPHQGPPSLKKDSYGNWDATGMYLIAYAMPRKAIRLTGSKPSVVEPFDKETAQQLVVDGRGLLGHERFDGYDDLSPDQLVDKLASWSPIIRDRAADVIGRKKNVPVEQLIEMLDAPTVEARQGACEALAKYRKDAEPAVPKLLETLKAEDLWLRIKAAQALSAIGEPAKSAVPELLAMVAKGPTEEDPRAMEQRYASSIVFQRNGILGQSLEGVDREALMEAVRAGLRNEDGRTRGAFASVYKNLTWEELQPLMPAIHQAIVEPAPSGIMFNATIQMEGLDLLSRHHVSEGIELLAYYITRQKGHGSDGRLPKLLDMLMGYGAHAQRAIPILEDAADYFENKEYVVRSFPKRVSLEKAKKVRKAIDEIKQLTEKPELIELNL